MMNESVCRFGVLCFLAAFCVVGCGVVGTGVRLLQSGHDLEFMLGDSAPEHGLKEHINGEWSFVLLYSVDSDNFEAWKQIYEEIGAQADRIYARKKPCSLREQVVALTGPFSGTMKDYFAECTEKTIKKYLTQIVGRGKIEIQAYLDNGTIYLRGINGKYADHERPKALMDAGNIALDRAVRRRTTRRLIKLLGNHNEDESDLPKFKVDLIRTIEPFWRKDLMGQEEKSKVERTVHEFSKFVPVDVDRLVFVPWVHMPIVQRLEQGEQFLNAAFRLSITPVVDGDKIYWVGEIVGYVPAPHHMSTKGQKSEDEKSKDEKSKDEKSESKYLPSPEAATKSFGKFLAWKEQSS